MWLDQPKERGGIKGISYPMLSDITKSISRAYGVLNEEEGITYRALFIIDKHGIIQSMQINNMSLGRNIQEVLRLVDAVQFVQDHGEVCPANWSLGQDGLVPTREGLEEYFKKK
jgi:peroxiredoxin (alkyl hydroperoxide reductase subunit C)